MRTTQFAPAVVLLSVFAASTLHGGDGVAVAAANNVSDRMLESLSPADRDVRRRVIERARSRLPACAETLLLLLASETFQDRLFAGEESMIGPIDPAAARQFTGGRHFGVTGNADRGALPGVTVTDEGGRELRYEAHSMAYISPLVLDLDRDGRPGVAGGDWRPHPGSVDFGNLRVADINGDGFAELTEWVDATDGLLVDPEDPTRVRDGADGLTWVGPWSGRDLVGSVEGYADGFTKLALRDDDEDGEISGDELAGLYVWQDRDRDALIDAGELTTVAERRITSLVLPAPDEDTGLYRQGDRDGTMWDWWPNYALATKRVLGDDIVGIPREIILVPRDRGVRPRAAARIDSGAGRPVGRQALEDAGLEWSSLALLAVSPRGSHSVLVDRGVTPLGVRGGDASILWSTATREGALFLTAHPVPASGIDGIVFDTESSVLVAGTGGSGLLRIDLESGEQQVLHRRRSGERGFRMSSRLGGGQGDNALPAPWPEPGPDPTADDLDCTVSQAA